MEEYIRPGWSKEYEEKYLRILKSQFNLGVDILHIGEDISLAQKIIGEQRKIGSGTLTIFSPFKTVEPSNNYKIARSFDPSELSNYQLVFSAHPEEMCQRIMLESIENGKNFFIGNVSVPRVALLEHRDWEDEMRRAWDAEYDVIGELVATYVKERITRKGLNSNEFDVDNGYFGDDYRSYVSCKKKIIK